MPDRTPEIPDENANRRTGAWGRRDFLAASGLAVGALALTGVGCSDDGSPAGHQGTPAAKAPAGRASVLNDADIPDEATIYGWIEEVFSHGIRRPGYPADQWAEGWIADRFRTIGLHNVRLEPISVMRWEPVSWSFEVQVDGGWKTLESFPVPFSAPVEKQELDLVSFSKGSTAKKNQAALVDAPLLRIPADFLATSGSAPKDPKEKPGRIIDPDGTLAGATHIVPFSGDFQDVMEPAIAAGAGAFVGTLTDYPGDSCHYFVPYDGKARPIPGVWLRGSDGAWLRRRMKDGPVRVRIAVDSTLQKVPSHNVVGELPGADTETVMIGSHHDGPWSSAVEDGSGISMVLAQATYWARQPQAQRPHRLVFLLHGGHMSGGAGLIEYVGAHRKELDDVVLEVHLEHAALEFEEKDGSLQSAGRPVPRWWFTSRIPKLEKSVGDALRTERVNRSMLLAPDAFGAQPPTDGALYHSVGVPIVQFLEAPFYLFDQMDTLDKIDRDHLVPITRAVVRIVADTHGVSAAALRAGQV